MITAQCLRVAAKLNWTKVRLANCHDVFVFISFNFNTHNLLSETVDKRGSSESCLDTVSEGNQVFMGQPLPFSHWPGKPSFCLKPIQSREVGWLWEGRWPLPCKGEWFCFLLWLIQLISTTVYKNTWANACSDSNSHLKYGSNFMASNFLCYFQSWIITIPNGALGPLTFCWCPFGGNRYASYKAEGECIDHSFVE